MPGILLLELFLMGLIPLPYQELILPVMPTQGQTDSITFTIDASSPTVTLTDTDSDNLVSVSEVVTITAGF